MGIETRLVDDTIMFKSRDPKIRDDHECPHHPRQSLTSASCRPDENRDIDEHTRYFRAVVSPTASLS